VANSQAKDKGRILNILSESSKERGGQAGRLKKRKEKIRDRRWVNG